MYSVYISVRFPYMSWACWLLLELLDNKWRDMSLVGYRALAGGPGPIITHFFFLFSIVKCDWQFDLSRYKQLRLMSENMREKALCKSLVAIPFEAKFEREKY